MKIKRIIEEKIRGKLLKSPRKIIIIYGPRQVGKTTLAKDILNKINKKIITINADESRYIDILSSRDSRKMSRLISDYEVLFLDEAQRVPDIGINLKILFDQFPHLKIITTGSSSFELANQVQESLVGRTWTYKLYPISFLELKEDKTDFEIREQLEERMIFGSYPEIFSLENDQDKKKFLAEITGSYLYKDVFELAQIKSPSKIRDLLKLLSFQIGNEVSMNNLSSNLGMAKETVMRYVDLLEKSFVIFRLSGFSRNLRKEVRKKDKIYFYDLGIRNAVIDNLKSLKDRFDRGQIWENYLIAERKKYLDYLDIQAGSYFWRVHTGAEVDYLEESEGSLNTFEFKWSKNKKARIPKSFLDTYPSSNFSLINSDNFESFLSNSHH